MVVEYGQRQEHSSQHRGIHDQGPHVDWDVQPGSEGREVQATHPDH